MTNQIFCICQILEKRREHKGTVYQLFTDFKKAYDPGQAIHFLSAH
jgi:hypothetical protein